MMVYPMGRVQVGFRLGLGGCLRAGWLVWQVVGVRKLVVVKLGKVGIFYSCKHVS